MSTRSSIFIKATNNKGIAKYSRFYKHSDGYPTGNLSLIHALCVISSKIKSVKSAMSLACKIDGSKTEFEGTKSTLNEIVSHNEHGDLEWSYLVDLETKNVNVYSVNGTSDEVLSQNTTDPLEYVKQLRQDCQANERYHIENLIYQLRAIGFTINGTK